MSQTLPILLSLVQNDTPTTQKLLSELSNPVVAPAEARRIRLQFEIDEADPTNRDVIARFTFDNTPPTLTLGKQVVRGGIVTLTPQQAKTFRLLKIGSAIKFEADFFDTEQATL